ncbi:MAG: efflux RND transporter periplasmic adaptor subunit [Bacteroidota bacterium]|jgi:cobalt-zinc-cadmium efflux system membrane fusion protein
MNYSIFLFIILLLSGCGHTSSDTQTQVQETQSKSITLTDAQKKNSTISIGALIQKDISEIIKVHGKIDVPPQNLISVSIPMGGFLVSSDLLPGMHVKKGQVIAVLEDQQYIQLQEDYLTTKVRLEQAESDFIRQKDLNESKAGSDKVFEKAKAEYQSLKVILRSLAEKLELLHINAKTLTEQSLSRRVKIYAPFNGFVSKVFVNIGKYVNPSDVLFELVNPKDIHVNLHVFEKDIVKLSIGQNLIVYTNSNPNKKYPCEILLISKDISTDGTAEVHCHFEQYDQVLIPGMYMNADISVNHSNVLCLPEESIVNFEGKQYIFLKEQNDSYTIKEIQTGMKDKSYVQILNTEELQNKSIVINGAYSLLLQSKKSQE